MAHIFFNTDFLQEMSDNTSRKPSKFLYVSSSSHNPITVFTSHAL